MYLLNNRNPHGQHFYPSRRRKLKAIVVHCTAGLQDLGMVGADHSAENTARYAATTDRDVSWHSGSDTDTFINLLPYSYTGWHCVGYNSSTAGHEISKLDMSWSDEDPEWVRRTIRVAAIGPDGKSGLKKLALDNGIPLRWATKAELDLAIDTDGPPVGFVSHSDLDPSRRTDPGRDFPKAMFFGFMKNPAPKPPTTQEDDDVVAKDVWTERLSVPPKLDKDYNAKSYTASELIFGANVNALRAHRETVAQRAILNKLVGLLADGRTVQPDELRTVLREELDRTVFQVEGVPAQPELPEQPQDPAQPEQPTPTA